MSVKIAFDLKRAASGLALIVAGVAGLSFCFSVVNFYMHRANLPPDAAKIWDRVFQGFYLGSEFNIPTWYASISLLVCAGLLALTAWLVARRKGGFVWHWQVLAIFFALFSLDEYVGIHESVGGYLHEWFHSGGVLFYAWIVPGAIFVVISGLTYIRFLLNLRVRIRILVVWAGALYVLGALGMEVIESYYYSLYTAGHVGYEIMVYIEETLEMAGVALFTYALLENLQLLLERQPVEIYIV